jgi:hypothetical protein
VTGAKRNRLGKHATVKRADGAEGIRLPRKPFSGDDLLDKIRAVLDGQAGFEAGEVTVTGAAAPTAA